MKQLMENWRRFLTEDENGFEPHMMFDPKSGAKKKAETEAEHNALAAKGYVHVDPAKIRKALEDEGGAAGTDAVVKRTDSSKEEVEAAMDSMPDVGQHKKGDYILDDEDKVKIQEDCWDGYERVPGSKEGAPGSCRKKAKKKKIKEESDLESRARDLARHFLEVIKGEGAPLKKFKPFLFQQMKDMYTGDESPAVIKRASDMLKDGTVMESAQKKLKEEEVEEGKICDKGIQYVMRTDPGGKDIKRGKEDKDGDGENELENWSARAAQIASKYCKDPNYGKGRGKDAKEGKIHEEEGGLKKWEKQNWTHSDGSPCGDPDDGGDGSDSRCKPASKWKTMTQAERDADDAKKKAGTKAGKQYVSATKKGKVKENYNMDRLRQMVEEEIEKLIEEPAKGKKSSKTYTNPKTGRKNKVSYGQKGATISPGTSKGDSYCARSFGIKKRLSKKQQNNPNTPNNLSRKKWKCKGKKSMK